MEVDPKPCAIDSTYELITNYIDEKQLEPKDVFVEQYMSDPVTTPEDDLVVEVYVPPIAIRPDNPHVELARLWAPHACDIWVYPSASPAPRKYHYSSSLVLAAGRGRARHGRETGP